MDAHDDDRNNHHRSPSNRARNGISYKMGTAVNQAAMNGRRMLLQASLVAGALLAISGCSAIPMSTAKPTLNMLPIFYKANPVSGGASTKLESFLRRPGSVLFKRSERSACGPTRLFRRRDISRAPFVNRIPGVRAA